MREVGRKQESQNKRGTIITGAGVPNSISLSSLAVYDNHPRLRYSTSTTQSHVVCDICLQRRFFSTSVSLVRRYECSSSFPRFSSGRTWLKAPR